MKTFNNLDTETYIRISSYNSIQFNIMQFNTYLKHCPDIEYVARSFDSFLNSLLSHETENTENPKDCVEDN